uniref:Uncharacterized protein n=1 Tax=Marmota marmota marmota TaxID=9994 RepID=A0A8C5ZIV0_MARMA
QRSECWGCGAVALRGSPNSALETLPMEGILKVTKKQMMQLQKAKSRYTGID